MKEITILSGKGGTGKTTITAALASLSPNSVLCDNDVNASNLHLILNPEILEEHPFESRQKAMINAEKCTHCGICIENCRFDAIRTNGAGVPEIIPLKCEGCLLCQHLCPEEAINISIEFNNRSFISNTRYGLMIHACMGAGEENSGRLVSCLRETAKNIAMKNHADFIIGDGPPGIGCPVIASITGTNAVLMVIEPSLSGIHDAFRLMELVQSFNIPLFAVINKFDINTKITHEAIHLLKLNNIPFLGKIPYDIRISEAMLFGKTILEYAPNSNTSDEIRSIRDKLLLALNTEKTIT